MSWSNVETSSECWGPSSDDRNRQASNATGIDKSAKLRDSWILCILFQIYSISCFLLFIAWWNKNQMLIVFARTVIHPTAILFFLKVLQERATLNRKQVSVDNLGKRSYTDLELLCESNTTLSFVNTLKTNIHNHKNSHHKLDFEEKQTGVECRCHNDIFLKVRVINFMVHAAVHVNVRYSSQRRVLTW